MPFSPALEADLLGEALAEAHLSEVAEADRLSVACRNQTEAFGLRSFKFIHKVEDVRRDAVIMSALRLMDLVIGKSGESGVRTVLYRVCPTSARSGFLEWVDGTHNVHDVIKKYETSAPIQSHLIKRCGGAGGNLKAALDNYIRSLAFLFVSTELLQIRDRHHENLLITDDGVIFNIDFGFCMGTTSKAVDNKFRLSEELICHLSPEDRAVFKETVHRYYAILRRHLNIFAPVLTHLGSAKPPIENYSKSVADIEHLLAETWKPGYTDEEARRHMESVIDNSMNYLLDNINVTHTLATRIRGLFEGGGGEKM